MACVKRPCAGELRTLCQFYQKQKANDGSGGQTVTPVLIGTAYAKAEQMSAAEQFNQMKVDAVANYRLTFRWEDIAGVVEADYMTIDADPGQQYNIRGIDNVQFLNRVGVIKAERGVLV